MKPDKDMKLADLMYGHGDTSYTICLVALILKNTPMRRPFKFVR